MIDLRISGDSPKEFADNLTAVAALMAGAAASSPAPAAPATSSKGKAKTSPPAAADAGASEEQSSAADSSGTVTRESVAAKCTQYGSPQKGGPAALKQLFTEFGSANGKWSEITDDQLPALNVRLDELLA